VKSRQPTLLIGDMLGAQSYKPLGTSKIFKGCLPIHLQYPKLAHWYLGVPDFLPAGWGKLGGSGSRKAPRRVRVARRRDSSLGDRAAH
jgi:hypothetical protein